MNVAVIIPAYNEEQTIAEVIRQFHEQLPGAHIWVVNNGSTDETRKIAERVFAECDVQGGVLEEPVKGKSNACRKAFRVVDADVYVMVDGDQTYPAELVHELIAPVVSGRADMVVADRLSNQSYEAGNTRRFHGIGNYLVCTLLSIFFGTRIKDAMSGYRAMSREFVKLYPVLQSGFELETEMTIHSACYRYAIDQIPCDYRDRPEGSVSKLDTFADGFRVLKLIIRLLKNHKPIPFFGGLALLSGLAGIGVGIPVIAEFSETGLVEKVPSAILASSLCMLAFFIALVGVVMDAITCFQYFNYEIKRNMYRRSKTCGQFPVESKPVLHRGTSD